VASALALMNVQPHELPLSPPRIWKLIAESESVPAADVQPAPPTMRSAGH
jgi:hypothetical protein